MQAGAFGLTANQVGDGQGEHAVEDVDADLLFGQWWMGPKETTCGSFICRNPDSTPFWER